MFSKSFPLTLWAALCFLLISPQPSSASIVVNGTRVVYPGNDKEVTVKLSNVGQAPMLVQSWIDTGDSDAKPEKFACPLFLRRPLTASIPIKARRYA
ncbi:putative chaperone protein EcpD [Serratia fonticola]|uniref:Putative chaperone protein EcpD n=1 Tax=Serratia fonticola TaxID=47917 RepID=A0A3S4X6P1_SERFO|nr:putative chaperone protein EcpD [Serratia fonticola]